MKRKVTKLLTYFWFNPNCLFVVNLDTYGETAKIFLILNTSKCPEPKVLKCAKHVKRNYNNIAMICKSLQSIFSGSAVIFMYAKVVLVK